MAMKNRWPPSRLSDLGKAIEIQLASRRKDGSLRRWTIVWAVTAGGSFYVRSAHGPDNPWYRLARQSGSGRIRVGAFECEVQFQPADGADHAAIDDAYHAKYDAYGARIVGSVVGPKAAPVTLEVLPIEG